MNEFVFLLDDVDEDLWRYFITTKEYWDEHGFISDWDHVGLVVPEGFIHESENCFAYKPFEDTLDKEMLEQGKRLLKEAGFIEVRN